MKKKNGQSTHPSFKMSLFLQLCQIQFGSERRPFHRFHLGIQVQEHLQPDLLRPFPLKKKKKKWKSISWLKSTAKLQHKLKESASSVQVGCVREQRAGLGWDNTGTQPLICRDLQKSGGWEAQPPVLSARGWSWPVLRQITDLTISGCIKMMQFLIENADTGSGGQHRTAGENGDIHF